MCLIALHYQPDSDTPLTVVANRDEFFRRPAAPLAAWPDLPIIGGRDLEAGGSWLALSRTGRFAAVTNWRRAEQPPAARSRGELISDFLTSRQSSQRFLAERLAAGSDYAGFNLLLFDGDTLSYGNNIGNQQCALAPGSYALSNAALDSDWPKVTAARQALAALVAQRAVTQQALLALLADPQTYPDSALPATGVPLQWERQLSAAFIRRDDYGTRAMTALQLHRDGEVEFSERSYDNRGPCGEVHLTFTTAAAAATGSATVDRVWSVAADPIGG